jgi:hypothetical protein
MSVRYDIVDAIAVPVNRAEEGVGAMPVRGEVGRADADAGFVRIRLAAREAQAGDPKDGRQNESSHGCSFVMKLIP